MKGTLDIGPVVVRHHLEMKMVRHLETRAEEQTLGFTHLLVTTLPTCLDRPGSLGYHG